MRPEVRAVIIFAILAAVAAVIMTRKWRTLKGNLDLLAELLRGEISFPVLGIPVYARVSGSYKGREVVCAFNLFISKYRDATFSITALGVPKKDVLIPLSEGNPTEDTWIVGNRVYCIEPVENPTRRGKWTREATLLRPLVREDIIAYLDKLTAAAEIVEASTPKQPVARA